MFDFIVANYMIFVVIAIVLLLGLFGYMMDKKKYVQYREEILNDGKVSAALDNVANVSNVATAVKVNEVEAPKVKTVAVKTEAAPTEAPTVDPLSGNINN